MTDFPICDFDANQIFNMAAIVYYRTIIDKKSFFFNYYLSFLILQI
jgi:hypothetical protein